jgi:dTDP-4-amino-4,6-dideoxygalactose transaminase
LALAAHGVDRTFTVAMPDITFWATYEAVIHSGARPLLIDIDPDDLQMSFDEFQRAHDRYRFRAAILPHLFGGCSARLVDFRSFCRSHNIILIEDGAQAFGVTHEGKSVFADADTITLSFYPAKVIGGITDGGAVLTAKARTARLVDLLANHGRTGHYAHDLVGWNSRMNEINAAWLTTAVAASKHILGDRRASLQQIVGSDPKRFTTFPGNNGYLCVGKAADPAAVCARMLALDVGCMRVYPQPISTQVGAAHGLAFGDSANSIEFCAHVINPPLFYGMSADQCNRVADAFQEALR